MRTDTRLAADVHPPAHCVVDYLFVGKVLRPAAPPFRFLSANRSRGSLPARDRRHARTSRRGDIDADGARRPLPE